MSQLNSQNSSILEPSKTPIIPPIEDVPELVRQDPWLEGQTRRIRTRILACQYKLRRIENQFGGWDKFIHGQREMGLRRCEDGSWIYREWAPAAKKMWLVGDFNYWEDSHPLTENSTTGIWEISLPPHLLKHSQRYKVRVENSKGEILDRIPAWANWVVQDPLNRDFAAAVWEPENPYQWQNLSPKLEDKAPYIYEAHIGMSGEEPRIHTYNEMRTDVLPRIQKLGYNVIQLMAIQEHPYYGSFGYQVSSFFAPSSRFGTPDDLKALIDAAHGMGIMVLLDIVHAHAVKNISEGLNNFDGSDGQYFLVGPRGDHPQWDSKCFAYSKPNVERFLLSNITWWLEEFRFDGFRFDGVTSMLYVHHGTQPFLSYDDYFGSQVDHEAVTYLQLASFAAKSVNPNCLLIAEDMSGMPGLCRPVSEGGIGMDYRLAMGIPDYWIKLLKHKKDEEWDVGEIWGMLTNRRVNEKHIAYAESHDQALVGDKTLAFRLMDADMYWHMRKDDPSEIIKRGIALHKMIRLLTFCAGGEGWLNFMGNEFGHPEWIDFPREGNKGSYQYCRRQWSLVDSSDLKYQFLANFDYAMLHVFAKSKLLAIENKPELLDINKKENVIVLRRENYIFAFNFSVSSHFDEYEVQVPLFGGWSIVLDSNEEKFGGIGRLPQEGVVGSDGKLVISLRPRSVIVLHFS